MRAALLGIVVVFGIGLFAGCSPSTPTTSGSNNNAPPPEDSGADKNASKGKTGGGRFPTPPPK